MASLAWGAWASEGAYEGHQVEEGASLLAGEGA